MNVVERIDNYLEEGFVSNLTKLTTDNITSIVKRHPDLGINKVYDSKYMGVYKDSYFGYLVIYHDDIEGTYFISRLWFVGYLGKEHLIAGHENNYNEKLNDDSDIGFKSLNDASKYMRQIKINKELIKVASWIKY